MPSSDDVVVGIGRLLRRAHDAQRGRELLIHGDLFWTNVIFRDGLPHALIDWELARPASRVLEVGLASTYWAGIRIDEQLREWGVPIERRGERLRLLCDAYGLDAAERGGLLEELIAFRRERIAKREWRGATPIDVIRANLRWVEDHATELATFLT